MGSGGCDRENKKLEKEDKAKAKSQVMQEAKKGKEMGSFSKLPEGTQPSQQNLILNFWPPEL